MSKDRDSKLVENIKNIQKVILFLSFLVIPISIIPFPWDVTEYSMAVSLAIFAIPLLTLELIKLLYLGKVSIPKGILDIGLLLLIISVLLSTFTSEAVTSSLWGFDFRFGGGAVALITLFLFTYSSRTILDGVEDVLTALNFLLAGISIAALLSILSFFGLNVLSFIPAFDTLFTTGLPIYNSARASIVIFGTSFIISTLLTVYSLKKSNLIHSIFPVVALIVNLTALMLFSLVQGWEQILLLIFSLLAILILPFFRKRPLKKAFVGVLTVSILLLALSFILLKIPAFKDMVARKPTNLITQLTINPQVAWKVATSSVGESGIRTLFGMGQDTFSIGYNMYRPLSSEIVILNTTNFTSANNQVVNIVATRGVFGILVWIFLLFLGFKNAKENLMKSGYDNLEDFLAHALNISILYILLSSLFIYYTYLINILLFVLISLSVVVKGEKVKETSEKFVLRLGIFMQSIDKRSKEGFSWLAIGIVAISSYILFLLFQNIYSNLLILKAEVITAQARDMQLADNLEESVRINTLIEASNLYGKASSYIPYNDLVHRRASLIVSQYIELLAQRYNASESEPEKEALFAEIASYIEIVAEESKRATDINPRVYSNWGTRSSVYSKLVGLGLTSYTKSALSSLQQAATLNPLNFEIYYNAAQLYVVSGDNDSALRTLTQVFTINEKHVPSLILAGELSFSDKDYRQAERYFRLAKDVMDELSSSDSEVYNYVVKKITELGNLNQSEDNLNEQESNEETEQ